MINFKDRDYSFKGKSLKSEIFFSAKICLSSIEERLNKAQNVPYWILRDKWGAQFSCWNPEEIGKAKVGETFAFEGKVRITKGGTYLNIEKISPLEGDPEINPLDDSGAPEVNSPEDLIEPQLD